MNKYRAPRRLRTARAGLSEKPVCELPLVFASLLKVSEGSSCAPIYSPARTFWLFLYQVLVTHRIIRRRICRIDVVAFVEVWSRVAALLSYSGGPVRS